MTEARKLAAILAADIAGYSRLASADEERTLARLRALRSDLIDPAVAIHHGRVVKRMGDGFIAEFRSVVDAMRCALEVQSTMAERNAGVSADKRLEFRVGIHVGDVVEEADGDLMGDGVNVAARLEAMSEPGGICLSEDGWRQVRDRVKEPFVDLGEKALKNIARPMRVYAIEPANASNPESPLADRAAPPRLSIVVLPFANIGGGEERDYFVDGVTESLTTDLSRISGSFVIARNTAFAYKGKAVDAKKIGRDLNVRYLLEGSVQRGGSRMRINVQLIDAATGSHLWAERFEKPVADLFDMQDEIVARIANALNAQLVAAEARRAERAPTPDSMDLCFQGLAWLNRGVSPEALARACAFFDRALDLDPTNVEALVGVALANANFAAGILTPDRSARFAAAEQAAARALSLAPDHAVAHLSLGLVLGFTGRVEQGIAECERALALNPNVAGAHAVIGHHKTLIGRSAETEDHVREALRLSPRDPWAFVWLMIVGIAKSLLGEREAAIASLRRSIEHNRNYPLSHFHLAGELAALGRIEEARAVAAEGLGLDPQFTIARYRAVGQSGNQDYLRHGEAMMDSMRKAGVPEG